MVFPVTKLPVKVELQLASAWVDVTAYTYLRERIAITRGRRTEDDRFEPSECALTLNNAGGRFSPRNPTGPYYGQLTRNNPIRVSVQAGGSFLQIPAVTTDYISTPDSAGLSVTGDIDLRLDVRLSSGTQYGRPLRKFATAGQTSYAMSISGDGTLNFFWSADGTTFFTKTSTSALPTQVGRVAIRGTLDVNNGAAGNTVTFYYSDTISGTWTQLGAPVVTAGTTAIFDGTSPVQIGLDSTDLHFYAAEIRNGINGAVVASPNFATQTAGASSFVDAQGNTWTLQGNASITDRRFRFYGEVPSWPQTWDISQRDVYTSISAAGVLRRLGQGTAPLKSALQRYVVRSSTTAYAYWPMEDADGSTSIASGLAAGAAMSFTGTPRLSADSTILSSNPLPELGQASFSGAVNAYTATGTIYAHFVLSVPQAGDVSGVLLRVYTTGSAARWDLSYTAGAGGSLTLQAFDSTGAQILTNGPLPYLVEGLPASIHVQFVQNGANIDWRLEPNSYVAGASGFGGATTGTLNSRTVGAATTVQLNPGRTLDQSVIGQIIIYAAVPDSAGQLRAARGYVGETAGRRIERLCSEESIAFTTFGNLDDTEAVGPQTPQQLLDLLAECEATDMGQLFESRESLGLAYRPRSSKYAQTAALALAYQNLSSLEPVEDDQRTRNDITVARNFGSTARATVDTGPLSTQAPPNGVGRYDDEVQLSLATDSQLADQANWRVQAGTVDEPRYPVIHAQLASRAFAASTVLVDAALAVDCGDLLTVTNPPVWLPPDRIDQHVIGTAELLGTREYAIDYVCEPITPAGNAGTYDGTARHASGGVSVLTGTLTTSATSVSVTTPSGPLWTTNVADFPFDVVVAGEQMTVTAISGTSSPQTFAVTRSANGVIKTHAAGESVEIYRPTRYAL